MSSRSTPHIARIASGLKRRFRSAFKQRATCHAPAALACHWLLEQIEATEGAAPLLAGNRVGDCAATAGALPALAAMGQRDAVRRLQSWLLSQQLADGMFPDAAGRPCQIATAAALRSLLASLDRAIEPNRSRLVAAILAASRALLHRPDSTQFPGSLTAWVAPSLELAPLAALYRAGTLFNEPAWTRAAHRGSRQVQRSHDVSRWNMPTHLLALQIQALLDLGWHDEARRALSLPAACQRGDGDVPALPDADWVSSPGLARLAACWYALEDAPHADAALAALYRRQAPDGGFPGSWGDGAAFHPRRQTIATACHVLEAAVAQVAASFAQPELYTSDPLTLGDGRLQAVRELLADLPPGSRIADVGCGHGRYLHEMQRCFPQHHWTGIDRSEAALAQLPPGVEAVFGSLLDLPVADARFDAVYCVEALEHALWPEQAIAEIGRVLRPGGRLLVIDKCRSFQRLSEHQPWEIWFTREEVRHWLAPLCEEITAEPIAHGAHSEPTGLFLAWTGRRRRVAQPLAA